ncbi:hypothetical protein KI387_012318, partial [Taxus chinensis]
EEFDKNSLSSLITVEVRDVQGNGFPSKFRGKIDVVFLDLPQPWLALASATKVLKPDGVLCSFSPCIEQAINEKMVSLDYGEYKANINIVDSQESLNHGVLILVTGAIVGEAGNTVASCNF